MGYVTGIDSRQMTMGVWSIENEVPQDSPVRFIEVFVDSLDLEAMVFEHTVPAPTGGPPYNPSSRFRTSTSQTTTTTSESSRATTSAPWSSINATALGRSSASRPASILSEPSSTIKLCYFRLALFLKLAYNQKYKIPLIL